MLYQKEQTTILANASWISGENCKLSATMLEGTQWFVHTVFIQKQSQMKLIKLNQYSDWGDWSVQI